MKFGPIIMIIMIMYGTISYKQTSTGTAVQLRGTSLVLSSNVHACKNTLLFVMFQGFVSELINNTDMHAKYGVLAKKLAQCNFRVSTFQD